MLLSTTEIKEETGSESQSCYKLAHFEETLSYFLFVFCFFSVILQKSVRNLM